MLPRVAHQRIKVNIFDRLAVGIMVAAHAAALGGLSHIDPVGRSVAGSAKSVPIHPGFQQQRTMAVATQSPWEPGNAPFSHREC